jgi:hypothetical protein
VARSTGDVGRMATGDVARSTGDVGRMATGDVARSTGDVGRMATGDVARSTGDVRAPSADLPETARASQGFPGPVAPASPLTRDVPEAAAPEAEVVDEGPDAGAPLSVDLHGALSDGELDFGGMFDEDAQRILTSDIDAPGGFGLAAGEGSGDVEVYDVDPYDGQASGDVEVVQESFIEIDEVESIELASDAPAVAAAGAAFLGGAALAGAALLDATPEEEDAASAEALDEVREAFVAPEPEPFVQFGGPAAPSEPSAYDEPDEAAYADDADPAPIPAWPEDDAVEPLPLAELDEDPGLPLAAVGRNGDAHRAESIGATGDFAVADDRDSLVSARTQDEAGRRVAVLRELLARVEHRRRAEPVWTRDSSR